MKITIDSSEPLADVLRVISTIYDVTLSTADGKASSPELPRASKRTPSTKSTAATSRGGRAAASAAGGGVDPKAVRQWAWENGHEVSSRGSLPASVRDAYRAANPS